MFAHFPYIIVAYYHRTDDYFTFTGDDLLSLCRNRDSIADILRKVDGVWCSYRSPNGPYLWYCSTQNTKHLTEMIKKQKSPRFQNRRYQQPNRTPYSNRTPMPTSSGTGPRDKFYQDNINFIPKRNNWNRALHRSAANHPYIGAPQWRQVQQVKPMRKPVFQPMMQPMPNYYSNNAVCWHNLTWSCGDAEHISDLNLTYFPCIPIADAVWTHVLWPSDDRRRLLPFTSQMGIGIPVWPRWV